MEQSAVIGFAVVAYLLGCMCGGAAVLSIVLHALKTPVVVKSNRVRPEDLRPRDTNE